jgi:hypothetical protein
MPDKKKNKKKKGKKPAKPKKDVLQTPFANKNARRLRKDQGL